MSDHRRSPRINARLWIQVAGVDPEPVLRRANISLTGMYFEAEGDVGVPGTVQQVAVATFEQSRRFETMVRVVRVVSTNDLWEGDRVSGVGVEFMAEDRTKQKTISRVVQHLVETRDLQGGASPSDFLRKRGDPLDVGLGIQLEQIDTDGMVILTDWPVGQGETIRCEIQAPASGRVLRIEGQAVAAKPVAQDSNRFRVEVSFRDAGNRRPTPDEVAIAGHSLDDVVAVLLEETVVNAGRRRKRDKQGLNGSLQRIAIPSLLSFLEMERLTGCLHMQSQKLEASIFVREGRVIDVAANVLSGPPLLVLGELMRLNEGEFAFSAEPVERADALQMTTTALLLELARLGDEANRGVAGGDRQVEAADTADADDEGNF